MNDAGQATPTQRRGSTPLSVHGNPLEVADHELIRRIGKGSYGEVWLARTLLGSFRAVKFVERSAFAEPRPFEREFGGVKKFEPISRTHPGLIAILQVGKNERCGYFYSVMEIADDGASGQVIEPDRYEPRTLGSDLAGRKVLPLGECVQLGMALAAALKHLHQHGLVHRDVKPSNIIFISGQPRLADIGLVTAISEATTALGTRGYIPSDDPGSPAADLYALGKVLYEASTGKAPEQFPDLATDLTALANADEFSQFNQVLLRACESNAKNRYPTADAMRVALSRCFRGKPEGQRGQGTAPLAAPSGVAPAESERKLLSVLVVNVGTTTRADPETIQAFMQACLETTRAVVQRFEGTLTQILSDGVMATFGGAVAVEDHARRATHAGLGIVQALEAQRPQLKARYGVDFELRLAVNTGLAIATRGDPARPPAGEAVSLASRALHLARPGQLLVTEETWKATRDYFIMRPFGEGLASQGIGGSRLFEVDSAHALRTRIEVEMEGGLTRFVGRVKELELLGERLAETRGGRGRIVLVSGEPGVGKSRLLLEFRRSLAGQAVSWLAGRSISFGRQMAYLPIIDLLKRVFQLEETDDPANWSARLEGTTRALGPQALSALPFAKYLLSVPPADPAVADMDAQERRIKTFEALRNLLLSTAQSGPAIIAVEDLHWVDRTSEDFLVSLGDFLSLAPILMVVTYRPEYRNPFPERSFISRLTLQPLTDVESLELATQVLSDSSLPDGLRNDVLAKAEGNPFFVEEMIKSLVETGVFRGRSEGVQSIESASPIQVPDTIQDVIMSRIDRLEESPRRTLQLASVIGREFSVSLLETIADLHEPLMDSLQKLKGLELIYERSLFPEHTCFFKHALTQEVAYNSLLLKRRKELHCLVAAAIEEVHASRLPEVYGLLAYHYERGEEWERALDYLRRAAERCRSVGAYGEEAGLLSRAIAVAERLGQAEIITELRGRRGAAWVRVGKWADARPELESVLAKMPEDSFERRAELFASLAGAFFWGLDTEGTRRSAAEGHALAEKVGRTDLVAELLNYLGASQQSLGDLTAATGLFEQARAKGGGCSSAALANYPLALYFQGRLRDSVQRARASVEAFRSLSDAFAATFGQPHLGLALAGCGCYSEAARVFEEARQLGRKHEIWAFHARAVAMSAGFHLEVFDLAGHEAVACEALEYARSAPFRPSEVSADIDLVFNLTRRGEIAQAQALAEEAATLAARIGGWHQWLWAIRLKQARAELACAQREWRSALDLASDAVAQSRARGRVKYVVAGLETRAQALAALDRIAEAVADLREAIQLARAMGDPALFLRAAFTLLRIDGDNGLLAEAQATARAILAELPTEDMRHKFLAAEPVRGLGQL
jgi:class 3 adenylate cyclase/tetratricopeptide (TPR) repeat protein